MSEQLNSNITFQSKDIKFKNLFKNMQNYVFDLKKCPEATQEKVEQI